jgi:hypothetical protein
VSNSTGDPTSGPTPAKRRRRRRRPSSPFETPTSPADRADSNRVDANPVDGHGSASGATLAAPEPGNSLDPAAPSSGAKRRRRSRRRSRSASTDGGRAREQGPALRAVADDASPVSEASRALSESLQAAVLGHTSGAVLARGRNYVKRNRVTELRVSAGRIRARVLGSGGERYRVELTAPQSPAPPVITKIRWSCDCLYAAEHRRGTCKHVVAVALVAARRFERADALRRRWMGGAAAEAPEAEPAEFTALAERLLAAFTAPPVSAEDVLARAVEIAPPPFSVREPRA